ncbi:hypothetical protein SAMN04488128_101915 [Chitinophaga eiseniae]|uniref:Uncharacterized protein n=1 Tax=Chitinophaga eiseniae TaxID=634771 RepID=A0A1T4M2V8_9BACT|nr:hypothetical protein [Chitinophaga eiseniae]SJZ61217.1 hypothetical protein SAMN04488128_101915 [Chitinophaga eiseniae]
MKHRKVELDVDCIGGVRPLTKEDEKVISEFIKERKDAKGKTGSAAIAGRDRKTVRVKTKS